MNAAVVRSTYKKADLDQVVDGSFVEAVLNELGPYRP